MKCAMKNNKTSYLVILGAVVTIIFGIVIEIIVPESESSLSVMAGLFSGFGAGILGVAIFFKLRDRFGNKEKNRQREIESKDERNIEISRMAWSLSAIVSMIGFAFMGFIFVGLGYTTAGIISIAMLYVEVIVYAVAYIVFSKKY